jgi:hypothetical protein
VRSRSAAGCWHFGLISAVLLFLSEKSTRLKKLLDFSFG